MSVKLGPYRPRDQSGLFPSGLDGAFGSFESDLSPLAAHADTFSNSLSRLQLEDTAREEAPLSPTTRSFLERVFGGPRPSLGPSGHTSRSQRLSSGNPAETTPRHAAPSHGGPNRETNSGVMPASGRTGRNSEAHNSAFLVGSPSQAAPQRPRGLHPFRFF